MMFMGTEVHHDGFWHTEDYHRYNWDYAVDQVRRLPTYRRHAGAIGARYWTPMETRPPTRSD